MSVKFSKNITVEHKEYVHDNSFKVVKKNFCPYLAKRPVNSVDPDRKFSGRTVYFEGGSLGPDELMQIRVLLSQNDSVFYEGRQYTEADIDLIEKAREINIAPRVKDVVAEAEVLQEKYLEEVDAALAR
jgi:hypothetical protein